MRRISQEIGRAEMANHYSVGGGCAGRLPRTRLCGHSYRPVRPRKLPTDLSGREVSGALERVGFVFRRQSGSHMILRREEPHARIGNLSTQTANFLCTTAKAGLGARYFDSPFVTARRTLRSTVPPLQGDRVQSHHIRATGDHRLHPPEPGGRRSYADQKHYP